jgi:hypothetical protein
LPPDKTGHSWYARSNGALAAVIGGAWEEIQPREGWHALVLDQARTLVFGGHSWGTIASARRERLAAPRTYFVRADGDDANDWLANTSGSALDLGGHDVTVQLANGTWTGTVRFRSLIGDGTLILPGDETTPSNVYLNVAGAHALAAQAVSGRFYVRGLKIETSSAGYALAAASSGVHLTFRNVEFGLWHTVTSSLMLEQQSRASATTRSPAMPGATRTPCLGLKRSSQLERHAHWHAYLLISLRKRDIPSHNQCQWHDVDRWCDWQTIQCQF